MNPTNLLKNSSLVFVPVMDQKAFAERVGVSLSVVKGWIDQGYLQTVKFNNGNKTSKRSLINVVSLLDTIEGGEK